MAAHQFLPIPLHRIGAVLTIVRGPIRAIPGVSCAQESHAKADAQQACANFLMESFHDYSPFKKFSSFTGGLACNMQARNPDRSHQGGSSKTPDRSSHQDHDNSWVSVCKRRSDHSDRRAGIATATQHRPALPTRPPKNRGRRLT